MTAATDEGKNGWHVTSPEPVAEGSKTGTNAAAEGDHKFRVWFRDPRNRDHSLADLEFKAGVLTGFVWNN